MPFSPATCPPAQICWFTCASASDAPESVGLYAWYAKLNAGPADWNADIQEGTDASTKRFLDLLARHTDRFRPGPVSLEGTGPFSTTFSGSLHDATHVGLCNRLTLAPPTPQESDAPSNYDDRRASVVHAVVGDQRLRRTLAETLRLALPVLSAPLYVGVATNLRERLQQHIHDLNRATQFAKQYPDRRDELRNNSHFGNRAIGSGFSTDSLVVCLVDLHPLLSEVDTSSDDGRMVAEAAEWFLNRWHRPILGRR